MQHTSEILIKRNTYLYCLQQVGYHYVRFFIIRSRLIATVIKHSRTPPSCGGPDALFGKLSFALYDIFNQRAQSVIRNAIDL